MDYKQEFEIQPDPLPHVNPILTEKPEKDQGEGNEEEEIDTSKNYLLDKTEFQEALQFFTEESKKYISDLDNPETVENMKKVTDFIFDIISKYAFELKDLVIESNFFKTITNTIFFSNNIDVIYQLLICLGISIEKHPELIEISSFDEVLSAVYDALDRYANIIVSPALKIFVLSTKTFNSDLWKKIIDFMKWADSDETLELFWEIMVHFSSLWFSSDPEESGENGDRLKQVLKGINVLLCKKKILNGSLTALLNISKIIENQHPLWYIFLGSKYRCVEFVFENFPDFPPEFMATALELIFNVSVHNDSQPYLFTMLKTRFDVICDFCDDEDEDVKDFASMIICILFEKNHITERVGPVQALENVVEYLKEGSFRVKLQALKSIASGLYHYIESEELMGICAETGFADEVIDLYESENINAKRDIIESIRRMSCYASEEIRDKMRDCYGDFLADIEEYETDEIISTKLDLIYTMLKMEIYRNENPE